jgi:hypothetical protein
MYSLLYPGPGCRLPGFLFEGLINGTSNWTNDLVSVPGTKLRYSCQDMDQILIGPEMRECLPDGRWNDSPGAVSTVHILG